MSKFKLDFDISTPARRLVPRVVARCPSEPPKSRSNSHTSDTDSVVVAPDTTDTSRRTDAAEESSAPKKVTSGKQNGKDNTQKKKKKQKGTRIPVIFVQLLGLGIALVVFSSSFSLPKPRTTLRTSRRVCVPQTLPVHSVVCQNHCRRLGHTECVVEFETAECADALQSVHFHFADGSTRRVPAVYQRLSNSTMFALEGDRAVFQPTRCKAHTSAVVVQSNAPNAEKTLRNHVVWIAEPTSKSFRVVRNGVHVLADVSAGFVVDRCTATFCVYKLETRCKGHVSTQIIAVGENGKESHAETFVYCD